MQHKSEDWLKEVTGWSTLVDPDWDEVGLLSPWVEMHILVDADQVLWLPSVPWHLICLRLLKIFLLWVYMLYFFFEV